jgi:hypothetical protein
MNTWRSFWNVSLITTGACVSRGVSSTRIRHVMWKHSSWNAVFSEWKLLISVGFEVLTAAVKKSTIFLLILLCSPLKAIRRFGGTCSLRLQGWGIYQKRKQHASSIKQSLLFDSEDEAYMYLRNVGWHWTDYKTLHPRRYDSSTVISLDFISRF